MRGGLRADVVWPLARLAEGVEALALAAGLAEGQRADALYAASPRDARDTARREGLADWLGIAIETVAFGRGEALDVARGAPAVLFVEGGALLVLACQGRRATLVAHDGRGRKVPLGRLLAALFAVTPAEPDRALERGLSAAGLGADERADVLARLARERDGAAPISAWLLAPRPGAPWRAASRALRAGRRLAAVVAAKAGEEALWIVSWWLIGRGALEGRFDTGWLAAWALLVLSVVPVQLWTFAATGRLAVDLGAEIRRRLMAGALATPPDVLRREGVGQSLGRVLESDALESLALGGGFLALFAVIEVVAALAVLALGASPIAQTAALALWIALTGWLAHRYFVRRRSWTDRRLALTHELIESMVGHATRLVQEHPDRYHAAEDGALAAYLPEARAMDRAAVALTAWVPRGWMLVGLATMAPAFLSGGADTRLAVSLGGVLLGYRALRKMVDGLADVAAAGVAWERVRPVLRALEGDAAGGPQLGGDESARPKEGVPVLSARGLSLGYAGRSGAVLDGCDVEVARGQKLVLEGRSGSGKSSLASVLGGLRAPDAGLVLADGLDRRTLGEHGWRGRVALAPQFHENHVFGGSLLFNLLMGREWPPSPDDVRDAETACERLGLGGLLARMPAGIHQWVGETGWRLSHGERARVWIARALLQRADVVLVDEGLDTLDPDSLHRVQDALRAEEAAVLVIAHP